MLINGMYPHFLLGVFEVKHNLTPKFIINPWLYKILKENKTFNYTNGLPIDQTNFHKLAEEMGYSNYFFHFFGNDNDKDIWDIYIWGSENRP